MNAFELVGIVLVAIILAGGGVAVGRAIERDSRRSEAHLEEERRKAYLKGQEDQRLIDRPRPDIDPPPAGPSSRPR